MPLTPVEGDDIGRHGAVQVRVIVLLESRARGLYQRLQAAGGLQRPLDVAK